MRAVRSHLRRGTWLALLSLWLLALAPTLARLQAAADPLAWVPVCTSQGLVQGQTAPDGSPLPNPADHLRPGDSLLAALQGQVSAPGLAAVVLAVPALPAEALPAVPPHAGRPAPAWAGAQARAPPTA